MDSPDKNKLNFDGIPFFPKGLETPDAPYFCGSPRKNLFRDFPTSPLPTLAVPNTPKTSGIQLNSPNTADNAFQTLKLTHILPYSSDDFGNVEMPSRAAWANYEELSKYSTPRVEYLNALKPSYFANPRAASLSVPPSVLEARTRSAFCGAISPPPRVSEDTITQIPLDDIRIPSDVESILFTPPSKQSRQINSKITPLGQSPRANEIPRFNITHGPPNVFIDPDAIPSFPSAPQCSTFEDPTPAFLSQGMLSDITPHFDQENYANMPTLPDVYPHPAAPQELGFPPLRQFSTNIIPTKSDKPVRPKAQGKIPKPAPPKLSETSCWTCRLRKKSCDKVMPGCTTCKRIGVNCAKYSPTAPEFMTNNHQMRQYRKQIREKMTAIRKRAIEERKVLLAIAKEGDCRPSRRTRRRGPAKTPQVSGNEIEVPKESKVYISAVSPSMPLNPKAPRRKPRDPLTNYATIKRNINRKYGGIPKKIKVVRRE